MTHIIFSNGFGFDNRFWAQLSELFRDDKDVSVYCKHINHLTAYNRDNRKVIGIAHSLGFPKLIHSNQGFDYLIGLNAFVNFLGTGRLQKRRGRELVMFQKQLQQNPTKTLNAFYTKCGASGWNALEANLHLLYQDIVLLNQAYVAPSHIPTLIISAADDPIVPLEVVHDNFDELENVTIDILPRGLHALGLVDAKLIYQKIHHFINHAN
ncbi:hypothetical protein EDM53_01325 [Rickettsiales endosymbiont of Peranema trichophorum]|uniref:hypothetical protein n=1 Tax=Rickettsiales endosymbiont of Peranema trichophorum TaxID=2486577 RepID=UPI0010237DB1|nr:hypothetical protein [Rickettsiales endosymbiont of Peranema trichophorum]RZI47570.1 hypothetical protein EDM53_01325 [Rickettsiales endosymbiont of Peranema trichophorum]